MSKKGLLSSFMFRNKFLNKIVKYRNQKNVHILAYHRLCEKEPQNYVFNSELFSATTHEFDKQMQYVSDNFNVITFNQLDEYCRNDRNDKNLLIITFDDGYYDNYSLAMPILDKYKLPATVYLATKNIDTGELFWFDAVAAFFKTYTLTEIDLESIGEKINLKSMGREHAFKHVGKFLKYSSDSIRSSLLLEIYEKYKFQVSDKDYKTACPLSWDNVVEMSNHNIDFGGHTKSHCFLDRINSDMLDSEISGSMKRIEDKLGKYPDSFCYPAGVTNEKIKKYLENNNITYGVGYRHGINVWNNMDRYDLFREHVELDVNFNLFKANLMLPEIFMR